MTVGLGSLLPLAHRLRHRRRVQGQGGGLLGAERRLDHHPCLSPMDPGASSSRYKDGSLICQAADPGKYRIESMYGVHTLEINR